MCTPFSRIPQAQLLRPDSFFTGALCVLSGGRLPEALFVVFLLDSKGAGRAACQCAPSFRDFPRHRCCGLIVSFRGRVLRPEDACPKRFSWFFYWIPKVQKYVNLVDLVKGFQTSIYYLLVKIGFDTAENEPLKVCQKLAKS